MKKMDPMLIVLTISLIIIFLKITPTLAQNDPGHDSLYILKAGNSTITGSLNISNEVTTKNINIQERLFSPHLVIRGDGESSLATNNIYGTETSLTITSQNQINIGQGGVVRIGTAGAPTILNITGQLWAQGERVCLEDGTNCPRITAGEVNISTLQAGDGIIGTDYDGTSNATWALNTTHTDKLYIKRTGDNITGKYDFNETMFIDTTTKRIGLGTENPNTFLEIRGDVNISNSSTLHVQEICLGDECEMTWPSTGGSTSAGWTNTTSTTTETDLNVDVGDGSLFVNSTNKRAGINTKTPSYDLDVNGTVAANEICINGNCQSSISTGAITTYYNKTTTTHTGNMSGYANANQQCNNEYPGTHLCSVQDILNTINTQNLTIMDEWTGTAWIAGGPPGYTANANDCKGFTSQDSAQLGKFWDFDDTTSEGMGWMTNCANEKPLACCKAQEI